MTLIIEIALGIVLGVVLLRLLPWALACGCLLAVLGGIGAAIYYLIHWLRS